MTKKKFEPIRVYKGVRHYGFNHNETFFGGSGVLIPVPKPSPETLQPPSEATDPMQPAIDAVEDILRRDFGDRYNPKA